MKSHFAILFAVLLVLASAPVTVGAQEERTPNNVPISDAYRIPVSVESVENGGSLHFGLSAALVGAVVLLVAVGGAGLLVVRRREGR